MSITVLVAPSGFKECLSAKDVTDAIATGVVRAVAGAKVLKAPMVDGGEGTVEALVEATRGAIHQRVVTGPVGKPVHSFFGILGGSGPRTAVIEIAAAAGLSLVPRDRRDPTQTTSVGVGELISAALDCNAERILIGCGDSGINDAGAGMLQALGVRLLNDDGIEIGRGGGELCRLAKIDAANIDKRISGVHIDAAVNWHNILLGEHGVARVFGPQKGATPEQVRQLECGLQRFANAVCTDLGVDVALGQGTGASGGLGAAILGVLGDKLHPRYNVVMQYLQFDDLLVEADLVITAEGSLDGQTPFGKIPAEVGRRAKTYGVPVIALAGTIGPGASANLQHGIDAMSSILRKPCQLENAIAEAHRLIVQASENAMRMVAVGTKLGERTPLAKSPYASRPVHSHRAAMGA